MIAGSALNGQLVWQYRLIDEEIDIKLKIDSDSGSGLDKLMQLPVIERAKGPVLLSDLCQPVFSVEPGFLNRYNGKRAITLTANIREGSGVSTTRIVARTTRFFQTIQGDYPGVSLNFAGEHEATQRSFTSLAYAFLIAILLIYLILANQFNSYIQPLIIISSVVFALIGIVFGTFISQTLFTIDSFIAIVGVTGVVVNSSPCLGRIYEQAIPTGFVDSGSNCRGSKYTT
jgi:HAE1 family hydrophobic/amphiphilic exporter-1